MWCSSCGGYVDYGALVCAHCGAAMPDRERMRGAMRSIQDAVHGEPQPKEPTAKPSMPVEERNKRIIMAAIPVVFVVLIMAIVGTSILRSGSEASIEQSASGSGVPPVKAPGTTRPPTTKPPSKHKTTHPPAGPGAYRGKAVGPVISGSVLVAPFEGELVGADINDLAKRVWTLPCPEGEQAWAELAPAEHAGKVVFWCSGEMIAVEAATGKKLWSVPVPADSTVNWFRVSDQVVASVSEHKLQVLDLTTGKELWTKSLPSTESNPIGVDHSTVYLGTERRLEAYEAQSGVLRWKTELSTAWVTGTDEGVFVRSGDYRLVALDRETGDFRWDSANDPDRLWSATVVGATHDTVVVLGNWFRNVMGFDAVSGALKWEYNDAAVKQVAVTMSGNRLALTMEPAELEVLDADTGASVLHKLAYPATATLGSGKVATWNQDQRTFLVTDVP